MNTCDTCKYWGNNGPDSGSHDGDPIRKVCYHIRSAAVPDESRAEDVNYEPCSGGADIATGPKFGCIHYSNDELKH